LNRARRYVPVKKAVVAASSSSSSSVELSPEPESESEESPERRPRRGRRGMRVSASASKMMDMGHEIRGAGEEVPLARLDKGKQRATVYDDESMEDGDVLMEKVCHSLPVQHFPMSTIRSIATLKKIIFGIKLTRKSD